ncbi:MAG: helix-turn-helix transcriptional regulator [Myxococcaceae bacterium]
MDKRMAAALGAAARAARVRAALTQADVAERIGISTEVYGRLERGTVLPSVGTLRKLCRTLGVSADPLLGLDGGLAPVPLASEPAAPYPDPPDLRRLMRRLRKLDRKQLRLISLLAAQLAR